MFGCDEVIACRECAYRPRPARFEPRDIYEGTWTYVDLHARESNCCPACGLRDAFRPV